MKATRKGSSTKADARKPGIRVAGVNIFETKDGYALEAEMPGVNKDGLEITLEGNEITIVGRRAAKRSPATAVPRTFRRGLPARLRTRSGD